MVPTTIAHAMLLPVLLQSDLERETIGGQPDDGTLWGFVDARGHPWRVLPTPEGWVRVEYIPGFISRSGS